MRRIAIFAIVMVVALFEGVNVQGSAQHHESVQETKQEILKLEEQRNEALQKGDVSALSRFYTPDLVYGNERGEVFSEAQHLAAFRARKIKLLSFKHDDVEVRVYQNVAVVTGRSTTVIEYKGKRSSQPRMFMNVWVKHDGQWLMEAHSETPIAMKKPMTN